MTHPANQTSVLARFLRRGAVATMLVVPLSACVVYPDVAPEGVAYDNGACCYSYYEYPRASPYPYYYGGPTFQFGAYEHGGHDGGHRHWR